MEIEMLLIVYLETILFLAVISVSGNCPQQSYILEDKSACYWLSAYTKNYKLSKTVCKNNNLQLAIIPNKQVNDQLSTYITNQLNSNKSDKVWIGVNDMETESVYKNSDGGNISWSNWYNSTDKEPNDLNNSGAPSQDCVCINKEGEWFDEICTRLFRALCFKILLANTTATTTEMETSHSTSLMQGTTMLLISSEEKSTSKENLNKTIIREEKVPKDKFLLPVIIVASVIFMLVLIIVAICIARKRGCRKTKSYESPLEKKKATETKDDEYDMLHQNRLDTKHMSSSNLYDHTNMNSDLYDSTIQNKKRDISDEYSGLDGKKTDSQTPQNYDTASAVVIAKDDVYYSSANYTANSDNDNTYGETIEGEYDVLNKRRNKQDDKEFQLYSHTGADETTYDLTVMNPGQNIINMDTYDTSGCMHNTTKENTYDTMVTS